MAINPAQRKLAAALSALKMLQELGKTAIRSSDLTRMQRESLVKSGFLRPIVKGWYMPIRPDEGGGDSISWRVVMRDFIKGYCNERFGDSWHVTPEYSLLLHAGSPNLPQHVVVHSPLGKNGLLILPDNCSLLDYKAKNFPPAAKRAVVEGIHVLTLPLALTRVTEQFFDNHAQDALILLHQLPDAAELIRELLEGGRSIVAGRLAGALRASGRAGVADDLLASMRAAGFVVTEANPFVAAPAELIFSGLQSPYVLRMHLMWRGMRATVLAAFPPEPGIPADTEKFMAAGDEMYQADAYHSLSIAGYRVTPELIRKVATGAWYLEATSSNGAAKTALAARGYWLAHNALKVTTGSILTGSNPGETFRVDHDSWFRRFLAPKVDAGILAAEDLTGYRTDKIVIRNAAHVPPPAAAVRDMMPELCDLLEGEPSAAVRAVLGHFLFVYIHPYIDGNDILGRFLLNSMLASGGYSRAIIRVEKRSQYLAALEAATLRGEIKLFAQLVAEASG